MKRLLIIKENDNGEMVEEAYKIPFQAIKNYLETNDVNKVNLFLSSEYTSEDTENIIDLCMRENIAYENVIHPDEEERPLNFYEHLGAIYDHDYGMHDKCYSNVEDFINHIAKMEVESAIKDCNIAGENVEEDEMYIRFKRLIDTQTISKKELDEVMKMCNYFFHQEK